MGYSKADYKNITSFYNHTPKLDEFIKTIRKHYGFPTRGFSLKKLIEKISKNSPSFQLSQEKAEFLSFLNYIAHLEDNEKIKLHPVLKRNLVTIILGNCVLPINNSISISSTSNEVHIVLRAKLSSSQINTYLRLNERYLRNILSNFAPLNISVSKEASKIIKMKNTGLSYGNIAKANEKNRDKQQIRDFYRKGKRKLSTAIAIEE